MRRVVTGQTGGKSVFVSDEQIEPIRLSLMPGLEFAVVWGGDDTSLPADGTPPAAPPSSHPNAATASSSSRSRPRAPRSCPRIWTWRAPWRR